MGQPVVHFEIGCRDKTKTAAFFSQLFDWKMLDAGPAIVGGAGIGVSLIIARIACSAVCPVAALIRCRPPSVHPC